LVTRSNGAPARAAASNRPWRGNKQDLYEGGIRVPALVRWPGRIAAGTANDSLALSFDWFPTVADLFGLTVSDLPLRGRSLRAALLDGARLEREEPLFWESSEPADPASPGPTPDRFAVRRGRFKLVKQGTPGAASPELFDLDQDPGETQDLAAARPELVARLLADYRDWHHRFSEIELTGCELRGSVHLRGRRIELDGGALWLAADDRFVVHDGELSFQAWATPRTLGPTPRCVAEQPGAWRLTLDAAGRLVLEVTPPAPGAPVRLAGAAPLAAGVESRIAFTLQGLNRAPTRARLFVDGAPVAESSRLAAVHPSLERIRFGGADAACQPFLGELREPRFSLSTLTPEEIAAPGAAAAGPPCAESPAPAAGRAAPRPRSRPGSRRTHAGDPRRARRRRAR
jgi:hypothetical protein